MDTKATAEQKYIKNSSNYRKTKWIKSRKITFEGTSCENIVIKFINFYYFESILIPSRLSLSPHSRKSCTFSQKMQQQNQNISSFFGKKFVRHRLRKHAESRQLTKNPFVRLMEMIVSSLLLIANSRVPIHNILLLLFFFSRQKLLFSLDWRCIQNRHSFCFHFIRTKWKKIETKKQ